MNLPRPDAGTPVHDYLAQHQSRMVIMAVGLAASIARHGLAWGETGEGRRVSPP